MSFARCVVVSLTMCAASFADIEEAIRIVPSRTHSIIQPTLINGTPVQPGAWKQTVRITTGSSGCTASVVGPRVIATASHCAGNGATSVFKIDGVEYRAKITRHPIYPGKDMDVALGLIDKEVTGIEYGRLPSRADVVKKGMPIRLMGFGCTKPGGSGGNDGILREGLSTVTGFSGYDIVTQKSGGSALCFGDSGGPAWLEVEENGKLLRVNISQNSKGDIQKTSYLARWDVKEAQDFVRSWAQKHGVLVCGINGECGDDITPKPEMAMKITGDRLDLDVTFKDAELAENADYVRQVFQNALDFLK